MDLEDESTNEKEPIVPASADQSAEELQIDRLKRRRFLTCVAWLLPCILVVALVLSGGLWWGIHKWHRSKQIQASYINWCSCPGVAPMPYQRTDPLANAYFQNLATEVTGADQGQVRLASHSAMHGIS